jgi:ribonuclease HI
MSENLITLYTDGSCRGNPGPGGWGFLRVDDRKIIDHGSAQVSYTTNNIMELTAVIEGIKRYSSYKNIHIFTDSMYVLNCAQGIWKKHKNRELWVVYDTVSKGKNIKFTWVKGHANDRLNIAVDMLAKTGKILQN